MTDSAADLGDLLPELSAPNWRAHEVELAQTSFARMLRRLPALVGEALGLAWQASRADTVTACALQLVSGVLTAFGLLATRDVLQALVTTGPTADRVRAALPAIALVGAAAVLRGGVQAGAGWAQSRLSPRVDRLAELRLYGSTTRVGLEAFDDPAFAEAMQRANNRGVASASQVVDAAIDTVTASVGLVAVAGTLAVLHPILLPLLVVTAVPRGWAAVRAARMRYLSQYQRSMAFRREWILSHLMTGRHTAADLRAFTMRGFVLGQYARLTDWNLGQDLVLTRRQALTRVVGDALSGVATVAVYATLGVLLATGHLPLAVAGTAVLAIQNGQFSLANLVLAVNQLYEEGLYFTDYLGFLADAAGRTRTGTGAAPSTFDRISVEQVSFTYPGTEQPALTGVTLTIPAGRIVALVGENGSGKTTLASLVAGLYQPDHGRIRWDDTDLADLDPESLSTRVAVITQDYSRWPFTARDNITLGAASDPERLRAAAGDSGAEQVIARLPRDYDTLLDSTYTAGVDLSGGQWQRIAVARGYHRNAPLLICDEPTAALDARAEHALYAHLREIAAGRTVILITHRLASVRHADHIYVLHEGRVEDHGTHQDLLARPGRYCDLYTMQASAYDLTGHPSAERPDLAGAHPAADPTQPDTTPDATPEGETGPPDQGADDTGAREGVSVAPQ